MTGVSPEQLAELCERAGGYCGKELLAVVRSQAEQIDSLRVALEEQILRSVTLASDQTLDLVTAEYQIERLTTALEFARRDAQWPDDFRAALTAEQERSSELLDENIRMKRKYRAEREKVARVEKLCNLMDKGFLNVSNYVIGELRAALSIKEDRDG